MTEGPILGEEMSYASWICGVVRGNWRVSLWIRVFWEGCVRNVVSCLRDVVGFVSLQLIVIVYVSRFLVILLVFVYLGVAGIWC